MAGVDFYITEFEPEIQKRLMLIRLTALDIFQDVQERIYHGMPTFFIVGGKNIMCYGAWKNHISIHLGYEWKFDWSVRANKLMSYLKTRYPQYRYTKYTVTFLNKDPFPNELIRKICELLWEDRNVEPFV